jgi:hypothetical protein
MAYLLPRAIIVLIAWGATSLVLRIFTNVDPLVFYIAGGVWAFVGVVSFGYLHSLRRDESLRPPAMPPTMARAQQPAE